MHEKVHLYRVYDVSEPISNSVHLNALIYVFALHKSLNLKESGCARVCVCVCFVYKVSSRWLHINNANGNSSQNQ